MATDKGNTTSKKPRKARSNDRRNNLKAIREALRAAIAQRNKGEKFVGMHFAFNDEGQAVLFCYFIDPNKPTIVGVLTVKDAAILRAALLADLHK